MWRRPVVTILMLIFAMILTLPVRAQQKNVAPGLSPAHAYVAASLPRHGGVPIGSGQVPPPLRHADPSASSGQAPKVGATTPGTTPAKPFTQEQVVSMVRDGFGDESGAKLIEQRGIDFAPSEDFCQTLKAAGASEAFLNALRAAKPPEPASAKKPLNQVQVFALLAGQVPSHRVTMLVQERGIDFEPTDDYIQEVSLAGGEDELISALKTAKVTKPATVDPAAEARLTELRQHVAHGAEFFHKGRYADAEVEYRAAVRLDPQNADMHADLALAHMSNGDLDEAVTECREALRLDSKNYDAHSHLGLALEMKGDLDGAIAEDREALGLNPDNAGEHLGLGNALGEKGDLDGQIAEYREALRIDPSYFGAHINLGVALSNKGDQNGAIAEYREALRLDPNDDSAHVNLGMALGEKGDFDGEITEEREALRIDPNQPSAHYAIGNALEHKGDLQGALEEYRTACKLNSQIPLFRQAYERLLRQVNK